MVRIRDIKIYKREGVESMSNRSKTIHYFHTNEISASSDGIILLVSEDYTTLQLEAESTGTCQLTFEGCGVLEKWFPLLGAKMVVDLSLVTSTIDLSSFYQFDLTGVSKVRIRLTNNIGYTTVVGKIVG